MHARALSLTTRQHGRSSGCLTEPRAMRRAAIFTRVSTDRQTTENQLQPNAPDGIWWTSSRAPWHPVDASPTIAC